MNSSATLTGCDDIIRRLREAIAEHPLSPIHGYAADIAALLDRLDAAERECERLRMELAHEEQRVADMMADVNRVGHENEALREALLPFVDEGIELNCDECGGDPDKCDASCVVRKGRAVLDAAMAARREK